MPAGCRRTVQPIFTDLSTPQKSKLPDPFDVLGQGGGHRGGLNDGKRPLAQPMAFNTGHMLSDARMSSMMMGSGTSKSQSNAPLPNPMTVSSSSGVRTTWHRSIPFPAWSGFFAVDACCAAGTPAMQSRTLRLLMQRMKNFSAPKISPHA